MSLLLRLQVRILAFSLVSLDVSVRFISTHSPWLNTCPNCEKFPYCVYQVASSLFMFAVQYVRMSKCVTQQWGFNALG